MNASKERKTINKIADKVLHITLETRNSDDLDFSEQAVWQIKDALEAAYRAGYSQAKA